VAVEDDEELSGGGTGDRGPRAGLEEDDGLEDEDAYGELADEDDSEEDPPRARAPWHFKILLVGTVGYLLYRLYQGIGWLVHHV
jgi:hypothetical protein